MRQLMNSRGAKESCEGLDRMERSEDTVQRLGIFRFPLESKDPILYVRQMLSRLNQKFLNHLRIARKLTCSRFEDTLRLHALAP